MFLPDSVCNPNPPAGLNQRRSGQVPGTGREAGSDGAPGLETLNKVAVAGEGEKELL